MPYDKLKPAEDIHIGCPCCSTTAKIAPLDMVVAVGFGSAFVTRDGDITYDGEQAWKKGEEPLTVRDIEAIAKADADHDWRIVKSGPLHGETFQRHGDDTWVCVESNEGFA